MKKLILSLILGFLSLNSFGFEIFALGTSNTNCKNAGQSFTAKLNELLTADKISAQVINAGVDGMAVEMQLEYIELDQVLPIPMLSLRLRLSVTK